MIASLSAPACVAADAAAKALEISCGATSGQFLYSHQLTPLNKQTVI